MRLLLDSVILIDHFDGIRAASDYLQESGRDAAISVITRAEVLAGFDTVSVDIARELLDLFPCLPITAEIADRAATLRRAERLKLPDALQAAVALQHGLVFVTRNTRDFQPGGNPEVLVPYQPHGR